MFVNYIAIQQYNFKSNLILQVMMTITAIKTTPPTATPQIRPTTNTNDYSNQNETTYCNTTNKSYKNTNDYSNQDHPRCCNTTNKTYKKY